MAKTQVEQFNEELTTKIKVKIVSSRGHDEWTEAPFAALRRIQDECTNQSKWAYLDGSQINPKNLTIDDLLEADDVTLTNALVGG